MISQKINECRAVDYLFFLIFRINVAHNVGCNFNDFRGFAESRWPVEFVAFKLKKNSTHLSLMLYTIYID